MLFAKKTGFSLLILAILAGVACQDRATTGGQTSLNGSTDRQNDTLVAEWKEARIFLSDVEHAALAKGILAPGKTLTLGSPVFQTTLNEVIDQRLLALEALRRGFDQNEETRRRIALASERILSAITVEELLAEKITDATVKRMFDEQAALSSKAPQIRARHILVASQEKAQELKELAEMGGDFSALAKEFSLDASTRDLGGDLGYFSQNAVDKRIADIAFATQVGSICEPFETQSGWHIIKVEDRRATPAPNFEEIKPEIVSFMSYDEIEKLLANLRKESDIQILKKDGDVP